MLALPKCHSTAVFIVYKYRMFLIAELEVYILPFPYETRGVGGLHVI